MTGEDFFKIALQAVKDSWGRAEDETDLGTPYFRLDVLAKAVINSLEQAGAFFSGSDPEVEKLRKNLADASLRADLAEKELGHMISGPSGRDWWKKEALRATNRADELQRALELERSRAVDFEENVEDDGIKLTQLREKNDELLAELAALELWHGRAHATFLDISRRAQALIGESPPL